MIFGKKQYTEEEILNIGLDFSMEFGKHWLEPIQKRLSKKIPYLTQEELDNYNVVCEKTRDDGLFILMRILEEIEEENSMTSYELFNSFKKVIIDKYNWINKKNLNHLYSQGRYYAWKDGIGTGKIIEYSLTSAFIRLFSAVAKNS
jgi:hypothetical protein